MGPAILGHTHPEVLEELKIQAEKRFSFGAPTELETEIAKFIIENVPNIDQIRMVSSGTEACMSAIRLARGYTGRDKIVKFEGCYHGHSDSFLIKAEVVQQHSETQILGSNCRNCKRYFASPL